MSTPQRYILVALPSSIARSHHTDDAFDIISRTLSSASSEALTHSFPIPDFKIGTLDALVQQADELAKLDANVEGAIHKVIDVLRSLVPGQEGQHKLINEKPVSHYLRSFSWNKSRYRSDLPISQLLSILTREVTSLDADIKTASTSYQTTKANLLTVQRKTTGNLTTRSLAPLLSRSDVLTNSEYLETLFIVVPKNLAKEFIKTYETLSPMVVPRSATKLHEDEEYVLYNVVVFKKFAHEFISKARANKYTPREFTWTADAAAVDEREQREVEAAEKRSYNEVLQLARTGYGELVAAWMHVKALRVFVESVLRYGLPLDFISVVVECKAGDKTSKKCKAALDENYGYLGGNAFGRDRKGKIKDDIAEGVHGLSIAGSHEDYTAYCYFEFEVA